MPEDPNHLYANAVSRFSQAYAEQTALYRLALRLQVFALLLVGLALLGLGFLVWSASREHVALMTGLRSLSQEHTALIESLRTETQALQRLLDRSEHR